MSDILRPFGFELPNLSSYLNQILLLLAAITFV
jgi:hypothetical protein